MWEIDLPAIRYPVEVSPWMVIEIGVCASDSLKVIFSPECNQWYKYKF